MVAVVKEPLSFVSVERSIKIDAPLQISYEALLDQLGPACEVQGGNPMPMVFEAWPGGRWFRDLGDSAGHWWGTVQVIKPPKLIEIHGPLFMSYPAVSHVQYRLSESGGQTTIDLVHRGFGELDPEHVIGVNGGWEHQLALTKTRAESK